jgi:hypothetical protein
MTSLLVLINPIILTLNYFYNYFLQVPVLVVGGQRNTEPAAVELSLGGDKRNLKPFNCKHNYCMDDLPFETIGLVADDVQALEDTYEALKKEYNAGLPCDVELPLDKFDLFTTNQDINVAGVLSIAHPAGNCYLAFIRVHIYYNPRRGPGEIVDFYKYQVWGYIKSRKDFGRVLIRRETFADRLVSLIHPVELDFNDDKPFNRKFYVCTNDEQKALLSMSWNFRNEIMDIKDERMVIEIADNMLVIGNNQWLDKGDAIYLAEIASKMASVS